VNHKFQREYVDQDGDILAVSHWPSVSGIVFETRAKGEKHGSMVELNAKQTQALIRFLLGEKCEDEMTFKIGDRVEYVGSTWPTGITGAVIEPQYDIQGEEAYQVALDEPHCGHNKLTMLAKNMRRIGSDKEPETVRARVLDEAKRITATDRNSSYGEPEDNFQRIADFWNIWLQGKLKDGVKLTQGDTAAMQIMVKVAREMNAPKEDNKTDIAGYAACWAEVDSK
jgi:Domain of unknown function (DUF6378)/Xrn1 SH3-like domain